MEEKKGKKEWRKNNRIKEWKNEGIHTSRRTIEKSAIININNGTNGIKTSGSMFGIIVFKFIFDHSDIG